MKTTTSTIAGLFGAAAERKEFEREARERADAPQTAGLWTVTTITLCTFSISVLC